MQGSPAAFLPCCHFPNPNFLNLPNPIFRNPKRLDFPILQSSPAAFLPSCHFPNPNFLNLPNPIFRNPKRLDFPILQSSPAAFLPFSDFPNPISRNPPTPPTPFQAQKGRGRLLPFCRAGSIAVSGGILRPQIRVVCC
jgi:hypothetical protein